MSIAHDVTAEDAPETPYERIGGAPTVRRVVDRLYAWVVRDDDLYLTYFEHVDLSRLKAHMVALLSQTLGGPREYTGRDLATAHTGLGVTAGHYRRVCDYVLAALLVEHPPDDILVAVQQVLRDSEAAVVAGAGRAA